MLTNRIKLFALLLLLCGTVQHLQAQEMNSKEENIKQWRNDRFGMFIHWGTYSTYGGEWNGLKVKDRGNLGEWIQALCNIPLDEYEQNAAKFNPTNFDAAAIVSAAKEAGMKYLVITSKHHEGFCMFDTEQNDYDIVSYTPYKKDPMQMLADECKKQGLRFGIYYSILDWHDPAWKVTVDEDNLFKSYSKPLFQDSEKKRYLDYVNAQLTELVEKYDPFILWFDAAWQDSWKEADAKVVYDHLQKIKPSLIINDRLRHGYGDFSTPEQHIPATGYPDKIWEACMTMDGSWGYMKETKPPKSGKTLTRELIDIASKGGNELLNIGPKGDGSICDYQFDRLKKIGSWMKINSEAVYNTQANPLGYIGWGRLTSKPGRIYAHVFDWPEDNTLILPGLESEVTSVKILTGNGKKDLSFTRAADRDLKIKLAEPIHEYATVVEICYKDELRTYPFTWAYSAGEDGGFVLAPHMAQVIQPLKYDAGREALINWTKAEGEASYSIQVSKAGRYEIQVELACVDQKTAGSIIKLSNGSSQALFEVPTTDAWDKYITLPASIIEFDKAGQYEVKLSVAHMKDWAVANIKKITLKPME